MNTPETSDPIPVHAGAPVRLKDLGCNEIWLQNQIASDPFRWLGLGEVNIVAQELGTLGGGSLDLLAADGDTYYSIEVQLGEVDASHSFRVFEYWADNRLKFEGKTHVAVLVVESANGRYRDALQALAQYVPLIVIELRSSRGQNEVVTRPEAVVVNSDLAVAGTSGVVAGQLQTEAEWKAEISSEAWQFHLAFVEWVKANLGAVHVRYDAKSYIGVWRGRRCWAPLWPLKDGARVHLPDPDGLKGDSPSPAMEYFQERISTTEISWQAKYNAGANPVSLKLKEEDLGDPDIQGLLKATFEIIDPGGSIPWSEQHVATESA